MFKKVSYDFYLKTLLNSKVKAVKDHGKSFLVVQSPVLEKSSITC